MNSKDILYSKGKNDECYTPNYAVLPILKYIPKNATIWTPFDTAKSEFVKQISKQNTVISSHIDNGYDFFHYEPEEWDILISNPPFTGTAKIFARALSFNKPFALLSSMARMNDKNPSWCFYEAKKDMQLLKFDKRIEFKQTTDKVMGKITFQSAYICYDFLPKQIILEELKK